MKLSKIRSLRSSGFTLLELIIALVFLSFLSIIPVAAFVYDGEREVNGVSVDCIGIFTDEPRLPAGYHWDVGVQPLVPSIFVTFPVVFLGPAIVLLTDVKCPVPDQVIPEVASDSLAPSFWPVVVLPDSREPSDAGPVDAAAYGPPPKAFAPVITMGDARITHVDLDQVGVCNPELLLSDAGTD